MATATASRSSGGKTKSAVPRRDAVRGDTFVRTIDLGNGVMFPVDNDEEAGFVEWMIEEAKAGRATLPKRAPGTQTFPPNLDGITRADWWPDYEYVRSERF